MHYLFVLSLLAALSLPLSVIASLCNKENQPIRAMAWYESWATPPSISFEKYTTLTYSFATTSNDASQIIFDQTGLAQFVKQAHSNGVIAVVSLGGAGGSQYFSMAMTPNNRTTFVNAVKALVLDNEVDGIEIDWEFPGFQEAGGCNTVSPDDSANYLLFFQDLRQAIGTNITISAAVGLKTWVGSDGLPLTDVSAYASVLDYISIMDFDVYGSWSTTAGPNSPLNDTCAPSADQDGSAVSGVRNWMKAGFAAHQVVLGVASYAHSFRVSSNNAFTSTGALALFPSANTADQPSSPSDPTPGSPPTFDQCGNLIKPSGVFSFSELITQGYLTDNGTNAPGIDFTFDSCSETPYVYNNSSEVMISYDNQRSFNLKGEFITGNNLAGFSMWYLGGDSNDILIDAISVGMGIQQCV